MLTSLKIERSGILVDRQLFSQIEHRLCDQVQRCGFGRMWERTYGQICVPVMTRWNLIGEPILETIRERG